MEAAAVPSVGESGAAASVPWAMPMPAGISDWSGALATAFRFFTGAISSVGESGAAASVRVIGGRGQHSRAGRQRRQGAGRPSAQRQGTQGRVAQHVGYISIALTLTLARPMSEAVVMLSAARSSQ